MAFTFYNLVFGSVVLLATHYANLYEEKDRLLNFPITEQNFLPEIQSFDFIIIGGGSSGCVIAERLSRNAEYKVLLLERGGNPFPQYEVPGLVGVSLIPNVYQTFVSVQQTNSSLAVNDGIYELPQAKVLGGGSTINAMIYNRGSPQCYNNWANIVGDDSWNYSELLEHFKASENCMGSPNCTDHLGQNGPMTIEELELVLNEEELVWVDNWNKAGLELGFPANVDTNSPQVEGFGNIWKTNKKGIREQTYKNFIQSIENQRSNLIISRYSEAYKIDIDANNTAKGVLYKKHGVNQYAVASKEVILSAGVFNSPLLLMKSGVGVAEQLEAANIPVKKDLPVGQFYQEHPRIILWEIFTNESHFHKNLGQKDIDDYVDNGLGPLSNAFGNLAQAFIVSSEAKKNGEDDWPDIQFDYGYNSTFEDNQNINLYICVILARQKGHGTIKLNPNSTGPSDELIWDPRVFVDDERDLKVLAEAAQIAYNITQTKVFQDAGVTVNKNHLPECVQFTFNSLEYWECFSTMVTKLSIHSVGTCKMGKESDPLAVVDSQLRVYGINNLRVVDNSIQPQVANGNTNANAIVIAQKGATMIENTWTMEK